MDKDDVLWTNNPLVLLDKITEVIPYDLPQHRQMNALMRLIIAAIVVYVVYTIGMLNIVIIIVVIAALYILTSNTSNKFTVPNEEEKYESNYKNNTVFGHDVIDRSDTFSDLYCRPDNVQPVIYYDHMDALGLYNANF